MKTLKALQIAVDTANSVTRTCQVDTCGRTTREGKDFCTIHVELHPYVNNLLQQIENRELEDSLVRKKGSSAVNLEGITVSEILLCLRKSRTRTEERLTREIQLDKTVIHNYLIRLAKEGVVTFGRNSRDSISVTLINFDPSLAIDESDD